MGEDFEKMFNAVRSMWDQWNVDREARVHQGTDYWIKKREIIFALRDASNAVEHLHTLLQARQLEIVNMLTSIAIKEKE